MGSRDLSTGLQRSARFPRNRFLVTAVGALILGAGGCERSPTPARASHAREVMGTLATLTAVAADEATAKAAVAAGYARLDDVDRRMSDYLPDSEVSRVNRTAGGEPVPVSPETFHCVRRAIEFGRAGGGVFDVTCRPLVNLWRQASTQDRLPSAEELSAARALVGFDRIRLDEAARTITLPVAGMQLDLGGIAKGYALDLAAAAMRQAGAQSALIDVGGDVLAVGSSANGRPWRIGVKHPFREGLIERLDLTDRAVATSGVQQRFYEIGGRRYSHIIDPRTGRPAEQAPSVTVIGPDGITADAWATAFSVLSVAEGRQLVTKGQAPGVEAMWITGDANHPVITKTPGFDAYLAGP